MPRSDVNHTFLLLKLVYFDFISYFITVIIKNTQFVLMHCLKPLITLLMIIIIYLKYEFGRSATFKKQAKTLNKKALAAFAGGCLSEASFRRRCKWQTDLILSR